MISARNIKEHKEQLINKAVDKMLDKIESIILSTPRNKDNVSVLVSNIDPKSLNHITHELISYGYRVRVETLETGPSYTGYKADYKIHINWGML